MFRYILLIAFCAFVASQDSGIQTCENVKKNDLTKYFYKCSGTIFTAKQCVNNECICVNVTNGDSIGKYIATDQLSRLKMTCECASNGHTYNFKNARPICDSLGNFAKTCVKNKKMIFPVPFGPSKKRSTFNDFDNDNKIVPIFPLAPEGCDKDGFFEVVSCDFNGFCKCVDRLSGTLLKKYSVKSGKDMNCQCAIDEFHNRKRGTHNCLPNGNYEDERETPCQSKRRKALMQKCQPNLHVPDCDEKGKFVMKQCTAKRCFCVIPDDGSIIGNYGAMKDSPEAAAMNCECARAGKGGCMTNGNYVTKCLQMIYNNNHLLGHFTPVCDRDGTFAPKQCHKRQCWCVNKNTGKPLETYTVQNFTAEMNCRCARDEELAGKNSKKTFACSPTGNYQSKCREQRTLAMQNLTPFLPQCVCDGSYAAVQCHNDKCFCAEKYTGDMIGHYMFEKNSTLGNMANCACSRDEQNYKIRGLHMTTHCLPNGNYEGCLSKRHKQSFLPRSNVTEPALCDCGGFFKSVQCDQNTCYCTNVYGHHIGKFMNRVSEKAMMTDCKCAKDLDKDLRENLIGSTYICDRYGNY